MFEPGDLVEVFGVRGWKYAMVISAHSRFESWRIVCGYSTWTGRPRWIARQPFPISNLKNVKVV
jgi:hypothetical protein